MPTFEQYVRDILGRIIASYGTLEDMQDLPGDLDVLKREWAGISGMLRSLAGRIEGTAEADAEYGELARRCRRYAKDYDFGREMEIMSGLYADDPNRIRNMRLKMLESFRDGRFLDVLKDAAGGRA